MDISLVSLGIAVPLTLGAAVGAGYLLGRNRDARGRAALTATAKRRALDDAVTAQLAMMVRYGAPFSAAIFDVDEPESLGDRHKPSRNGNAARQLVTLLVGRARETDVVVGHGERALLVVMPRTDLAGACAFCERVRTDVADSLPTTASGGVTQALDGDTRESLLGRAGEALEAARQAGGNRVYRHDGRLVEPVLLTADEEPELQAEVASL